MKNLLSITLCVLLLSGCETWQTTSLETYEAVNKSNPIDAAAIKLSSKNYDASKHIKLKEISVTVNKTTAFHPDPSIEMVEAELRKEAQKLGATSVVSVEITDVKISAWSWGRRSGSGIAVKSK